MVAEICMIDHTRIKTEEDLRDALQGYTDFQIEVYVATFRIPKGKVSTYSRIAKMAGNPKASRAVANALKNCPFYPTIPAHRVVRSDGSFTGGTKDSAGRRILVKEEGIPIKEGKVKLSDDILF